MAVLISMPNHSSDQCGSVFIISKIVFNFFVYEVARCCISVTSSGSLRCIVMVLDSMHIPKL